MVLRFFPGQKFLQQYRPRIMDSQEPEPKLLDQIRRAMRLHHYSVHTERSYIDWIKRYIRFHRMDCREHLVDGERKIEAFLTQLAVDTRYRPQPKTRR